MTVNALGLMIDISPYSIMITSCTSVITVKAQNTLTLMTKDVADNMNVVQNKIDNVDRDVRTVTNSTKTYAVT